MKQTHHMMVDIETLGTAPNSAIASIGACFFVPETKEIISEFYIVVDTRTCADIGMTIDPETVAWWARQHETARIIFDDPNAVPIQMAMGLFTSYISASAGSKPEEVCVWGNGAAFDNVILQSAYAACKYKTPWSFWNDRCYRTMKNIVPDVKMKRIGVYHNALDDAKSQAIHLCDILHHLGIVKPQIDTETHCPDCGFEWEEHEFAVPKPYCP